MASSGSSMSSNFCVLGYHGGYITGVNLQIYAPLSLITAGVSNPDISTMSHEMTEAVNDPVGANPTLSWGNIGETVGHCQSNLEVGDPLSPGFGTPSSGFTVSGANGLTYHFQELAFYNWFYGGPSLGVGGKYSSNLLSVFFSTCYGTGVTFSLSIVRSQVVLSPRSGLPSLYVRFRTVFSS
jgi:hypothetical protein